MSPAKIKLTDAVVAKATLAEGKTEMVFWDSETTGFGLRIRGNAKSYIVAYRPAGAGRAANMKRFRLGTPETIRTATEARRLARAALGRIATGADPVADRQEQQRKSKSRLEDLLARYDADLERRSYVDRVSTMRSLRSRMKRHLHRDVAELKGSEFAAIVEKLIADGLPGAAEGFRVRARAFMSWCMSEAKVIDVNPLLGYRKQRATRADRLTKAQHGRALSDDEIVAVWRAADPETVFGRFIRFLLLTGCRRGEGAGLSWAMIDRRGAVIEFPAAYVKQGRAHSVVITSALASVLDRCPVEVDVPYVFPSSRTSGMMLGWSQLLGKLVKSSGVTFTLHDLRRTFRSGLSRLGVDVDTAERALGHARAELVEVYDRDRAEDRLRVAFEAWSTHIDKIVLAEEGRRAAEAGVGAFG